MARKATEIPAVRCAIYTRKSTEEGLEQEFNTLDAQREAGESYIASQKGEGWVAIPDRYDDGGYTGGNMERPALKRLLEDVKAGKVDCIVVYKVDRLSRSLYDFAFIMNLLERREVFFVSVTQPFNTSSSMGRLTLNTLLSFAQFEREIIAERTRDKIAVTRRMGKWSGGRPVLGYDVAPEGGRLVVNEEEASRVRSIFSLFLTRKTLLPVLEELDELGWTNKQWTTRKHRTQGGSPFSRTTLRSLLGNILYCGKIRYKEEIHDGEHPAIIEPEVFEQVQALLKTRETGKAGWMRHSYNSLLGGRLFCASCGKVMGHTYTDRKGTRYRYYLCQTVQKGGRHRCTARSIPAPKIEAFVADEICRLGKEPRLLSTELKELEPPPSKAAAIELKTALETFATEWGTLPPAEQSRIMHRIVKKATCDSEKGRISIEVDFRYLLTEKYGEFQTFAGEPGGDSACFLIERRLPFRRPTKQQQPQQPKGRVPRISKVLAMAINFNTQLQNGEVKNLADIARLHRVTRARVTQIMNLLSLAPDIQEEILHLPRIEKGRDKITERSLRPVVAEVVWEKQRLLWEELKSGL